MITRISIDAFKAFGVLKDVELAPFTVLIGPNGSGKTTFLQAIELIGRLCSGTIGEYLAAKGWDYGDLPHLLAADKRFGVTVEVALAPHAAPRKAPQLGEKVLRWSVSLETRRRAGIATETVELLRGARQAQWRTIASRRGRDMKRLDPRSGEVLAEVRQTLTSSWLSTVDPQDDAESTPELAALAAWARRIQGYFFLDPRVLRSPSRRSAHVGPAGEHLAGFLGGLKPDALERITKRVRKHYPRLTSVQVKKGKYGWTNLLVQEKWGGQDVAFNARQVSDGLLRLLTVSALHELPNTPSVILLDEVENGLHPELLGGFVGMLQDLVNQRPGTQVIVTTHSPVALNYVQDAKQVLLVHRERDGAAAVRRLSDVEGLAALREHFELGELWFNVGEARLLRRAGARS